ncbi:MAG: oxidoreductase [Chitinophagaceae bacterium]
MALLPWRTAIVTKIENETYNTRRFWVEVPDTNNFDFKAGQFVTLDLPIHEKVNKRLRSYSISSWPDGTNVFELIVVLMEHGLGSQYLFNEIKVGSELKFRGPQGVFVLPQPLDKDLFLICTGTGVAPFRSMLHDMINKNIPHKNIYLVFGTRRKENLLYYEEMRSLSSEISSFHYLPVLSRENWEGHRGYVHAVYEELAKEKQPAIFMLCGWKNMIDEAQQRILQMGYDKKSILLELYG